MEGLNCSICFEHFRNPVTLLCGHTFCQACIGGALSKQCPLCKQHFSSIPAVNIVLRDVIESMEPRLVDTNEPLHETAAHPVHHSVVEQVPSIDLPDVYMSNGNGHQPVNAPLLRQAPKEWVKEFHAADLIRQKAMRREILEETENFIAARCYSLSPGADAVFIQTHWRIEGGLAVGSSEIYRATDSLPIVPPCFDTTLHFTPTDAMNAALFWIDKNQNPLLVIPADPTQIGGVFQGSASLEEQAYRRTTLLSELTCGGRRDDYFIPEDGCIYVPKVQVFRECEKDSYGLLPTAYGLLPKPKELSMILASSVRKPEWGYQKKPLSRKKVLVIDENQETPTLQNFGPFSTLRLFAGTTPLS